MRAFWREWRGARPVSDGPTKLERANAGSESTDKARFLQRLRRALLALVGFWLVGGWAAFLLVDVLDVGGAQALLEELEQPLVFFHLFGEARPTEWLQWAALGTSGVLAGLIAGQLSAGERTRVAGAWTLFAFGMVAMLIEDAGNPRHRVAEYAERLAGSTAGTVAELMVMGAVAALPLLAAIWAGWHLLRAAPGRRYLLAGYAVYGIAVLSSATRSLWYERTGAALLGDQLAPFMHGDPPEDRVNFYVLDHLYEESLELVAATLLLVGTIASLERLRTPNL
ncbi:hypothetical protein ER308_12510 [Egibacter rhizosphaerae]|uniref:Uncharacterized protein n=1 Tax=Egibacter rhizosphaerae TaxID=1670831 RepID=A0A411YGB3_9ACTN|nr:hypothetical protein [Egibacter rhizosphaerae]QBI20304.1 hypothetical protein ER308_12510 [Egibacter rhizosphaerae]